MSFVGMDGAFGFGDRHVEHVRVHAGVHVCVRGDGRATDGIAEAHGVHHVRSRRRRVPSAVRGVRVRRAGGRHVRDVRGDRPLAVDGGGPRVVLGGAGDGGRRQHDVHVPGPRARGRAGVRHRGHGAVPHVSTSHVRETGVARCADPGRVNEARGRDGRLQPDRHVRRLGRHDRQRSSRISQRVRFVPGAGLAEQHHGWADADSHGRLGRRVPVLERRRRIDHHQALHPVKTLHATMITDGVPDEPLMSLAPSVPFNDDVIDIFFVQINVYSVNRKSTVTYRRYCYDIVL